MKESSPNNYGNDNMFYLSSFYEFVLGNQNQMLDWKRHRIDRQQMAQMPAQGLLKKQPCRGLGVDIGKGSGGQVLLGGRKGDKW
jgi:hypothetical protein